MLDSGDPDNSVPDDSRVKQRLRELYDFKTETEWPKRIRHPSTTPWISKSSSEESQHLLPSQSQPQQKLEPQPKPIRRNSQDLEFNDRTPSKSDHQPQSHHNPRKLPERPPAKRQPSNDQVFESTTAANRRLRHIQDNLRFSEDLSSNENEVKVGDVVFKKMSMRERRTNSDDYENPNRRKYSDGMISGYNTMRERKRHSDSSARSSRPSYAEIESTSSNPRSSRTTSDASYVSIGSTSQYNPQIGKRGSIEFRSNNRKIEVTHRRTMSQYEPRPRTTNLGQRSTSQHEHRPRMTVPPPEIEDLYKDFRAPGKSAGFPPRQRRNSTRYKVYLT